MLSKSVVMIFVYLKKKGGGKGKKEGGLEDVDVMFM